MNSQRPEAEKIKASINSLNNLLLGLHGYVHFMETAAAQRDPQQAAYLGPMRELLNRSYEIARDLMGQVQELEKFALPVTIPAPEAGPQRPLPVIAPGGFIPPLGDMGGGSGQLPAVAPVAAEKPVFSPPPPSVATPAPAPAPASVPDTTSSYARPVALPPDTSVVVSPFAAYTSENMTSPDENEEQEQEMPDFKILNPEGQKGLILFVDDEDFLLDFASKILASDGYRVLTCRESFTALQIYEKIHAEISLVILDYSMPVMNGEDLFLEMIEINPRVRVLLSSGYFEYEVVSRLMKKGLMAFLPKPYTRQTFLQNVASSILGEPAR